MSSGRVTAGIMRLPSIFFHSLKTQLIHHVQFRNVTEAEHALFNYIEVYYNRKRKHSTNGYKAPAIYEKEWWDDRKVA